MTADPTAPASRLRRPLLRAAVTAAATAALLATLAPAALAAPSDSSPAAGCHGALHLTAAGLGVGDSTDENTGGLAGDGGTGAAADGTTGRPGDWSAADAALAGITDPGYGTSALAAVRADGRLVWRNATGVADLVGGGPADPRGSFRIGSATKTFVATTLLQLVGEHRLDLDDRLECLLPGIVPNSTGITVRQLLDHTGGVADYTKDPAFRFDDQDWLDGRRYRSYRLQDLVDIANKYPPSFAPGQDWKYSNTDYVLIGMIIEKLTGHSWSDEVARRIIRPLRLTGTWYPGDFPLIPGPHAHGYFKLPGGPVDVTLLNPSMAGPSGGLVSTTADLTAFLRALLGGRLLRPAELAAMEQTTAHGGGQAYGLGLQRVDTPCGTFWGHSGGIPGYTTMMLGSPDGTRQFAADTTIYDVPDEVAGRAAWNKVIVTALCGPQASAAAPDLAPDLALPAP
ncbi:serine hydrolase domain-containing protein [Kitasatospora sp. NPDC098652]|uniref:serine hydrolase domain-containing protein n=1 Tax=Kitasatospora sp. NPDC098652 TaxID=3364095 RepID=UPI003807B1DC